ncbi:TraR/DksA C4-type zinc finger protein [Urbifossiella limnaea]|nr:TraR/DksA C4-type zinc finger protein [Urbifossiella limnaea]
MASVREENERMAREAARNCCKQCPHPKPERDEVVDLLNGVRLSVYVAHCQRPGPDCTALVYSHLLSEPPAVANRMVEHLAAVPELAAAGVSWLACLAPDADRLILTYRVPASERVAAAVGAMRVEEFEQEPVGPSCLRCGQPIPLHRLANVPQAVRCWECQTAIERV